MLLALKKKHTGRKSFLPKPGLNIGHGSIALPDLADFDGNGLAWYDGNIGLTVGGWVDQNAGANNIVFANNPTIVPNATPGRNAVRFDGANQNGVVATPVINQPYTIYSVVNTISWVVGSRLWDDGALINQKVLSHQNPIPNLEFFVGVADFDSNPDLAVGTWGVMTCMANGAASEIRTNLNASVVGNAGLNNGAGITLASRFNNTLYFNGEYGYLIIRTGADNTATQNRIINGLRNGCQLTF